MSSHLSRRQFLGATAGLPLAAGLGTSLTKAAELKPAVREFLRGGMPYRRLGQTDIDISLLGFGSHCDPVYKQEAKRGFVLSDEGQALRDRIITRSFDLGVNILDVYEDESQREPAARVVRSRRDKVLISCARQGPVFLSDSVDQAAKLYGHVDLFRLMLGGRETNLERSSRTLEEWDLLRKAKETGKVRAIGVASHSEIELGSALEQLEGLDFVFFPYNFIHARADFSDFTQRAIQKGIGLIAIKPLAAGSIMQLDTRPRRSTQMFAGVPESRLRASQKNGINLFQSRYRPLLPAVVAELTKNLNRLPDETLCQAAMRFDYAQPFISCVMTGMYQEQDLDDNYAALARQSSLSREEKAVLGEVKRMTKGFGADWVGPEYRWLEEQWRP
jgi:predicted aldo/keto reductase-like oxidoreductase